MTRINKYIASCGITSRRGAEKIIENKQVKINNRIAKLSDQVNDGDIVTINDKIITPNTKKIYILLNKPEGYTCTNRTFKGEKNVFSLVKLSNGDNQQLFSVGRLDKNSSGLLILTNDGDFNLKLTHPSYESEKEYEVTLNDEITQAQIQQLKEGVVIDTDNERILVQAKKVTKTSDNKINIVITEGKKRQIRMMIKELDLKVVQLVRTRISSLVLDNLQKGKWRHLTEEEVKKLSTK